MSEPNPVSVDEAIEVLNRIHQADHHVLPALMRHRVPCNTAVADDPAVQVGPGPNRSGWVIGLLGVLNGIFGADDDGWGYIVADWDGGSNLRGFRRTRATDKKQKGATGERG